jgi:mRNA interferase RelE/StbE
LAEHLGNVRPEPLAGDLEGLYKLRVGDYRIIYQILHDEHSIVIHAIGHRRDVYRQR